MDSNPRAETEGRTQGSADPAGCDPELAGLAGRAGWRCAVVGPRAVYVMGLASDAYLSIVRIAFTNGVVIPRRCILIRLSL